MTQALDDFKNNKNAVRHDPVWLSDIIYYATLLHRQDLAVEAQKLLQTDYANFLGTGRYHLAYDRENEGRQKHSGVRAVHVHLDKKSREMGNLEHSWFPSSPLFGFMPPCGL